MAFSKTKNNKLSFPKTEVLGKPQLYKTIKQAAIICNIIVILLVLSSCTNLQAGIYLLSIDNLDGESIKKKEIAVKTFLKLILDEPENYTMKIYERNGISYQFKRTKLMYHTFYLIIDNDNNHYTLSFYGTKIAFPRSRTKCNKLKQAGG